MYWFFLVCFIFISISLIFLILLQPVQELNSTIYSSIKNNDTVFRCVKQNSFLINIIRILACLFLIISMILCNINNRIIESNFFLEDDAKQTTMKTDSIDKKILNSDIPY
ncbi:preprotein translocase subunit SecG [Buchnera aphidicola]|uniref:Protein-export membrane protein SecG n=1 Tax=Buchnera aphidicola str. Ua (Uroleucon ambrosiae) TaxID=1005057 RepID=G2LPM9_BUCUM|nr:preprotein translocase subunit SecG [Buchnera aphidicola]AEO08166.1 preprotein translocase subunit SecG [Buchnera aphidicola str. Ua (Uroleucon ambrosiae)]